ncbi:MAG TPA: hypothetical protein VIJ41_02895 [Candidatus Nanopelagicales bacterium]
MIPLDRAAPTAPAPAPVPVETRPSGHPSDVIDLTTTVDARSHPAG